ncbi:MAG: GNAT family N-acetyltransferase [Fimbriimonadaceae bacterium]|nr:GNAT family N-acetyltransferase [Fimbriimonadaceae bacterium]
MTVRAARAGEMAEVAVMFREYQLELGVDLCFQDFEAELAHLPGKYAEPGGTILVAESGGELIGVVAIRPDREGDCEMKRLYVRPAGRRLGTGDALVTALIDAARERGYRRMVLDTLDRLQPAIRLYQRHGFTETPDYNGNPLPGVLFFAREL